MAGKWRGHCHSPARRVVIILRVNTYQSVEFESEGATLRGRLYLPGGNPPFAAVAMAHGTSATITMGINHYAEEFAANGIAALLYDHRNFGNSDGEPRQQINPWLQARGYRNALDYLSNHDLIDPARLGVWGDSYSGGVVLFVAACDERAQVVVAQCPACGPALAQPDAEGSRFWQMRATLVDGDVRPTPETTLGPLPVVSADQNGSPSLLKPVSAFRWFIEYGGRHGSGWQNLATRVSPPVPEPYEPGICGPHVNVPTLALIAPDDEMEAANPIVSRTAFEMVTGPLEILNIEGGHFGLLYHPSPEFEFAANAQVRFLKANL